MHKPYHQKGIQFNKMKKWEFGQNVPNADYNLSPYAIDERFNLH